MIPSFSLDVYSVRISVVYYGYEVSRASREGSRNIRSAKSRELEFGLVLTSSVMVGYPMSKVKAVTAKKSPGPGRGRVVIGCNGCFPLHPI